MNMIQKLRQLFFKEAGAAVVYFVITIPIILSLCAFAFDGSRILIKKNRLANVLNEAALAISAYSHGDISEDEIQTKNVALLRMYIENYLPDEEIISAVVQPKVVNNSDGSFLTTYDISAEIKIDTLLPLDSLPSFSPKVQLGNIGKVSKLTMHSFVPTDFVFVVDFSSSMISPSADPDGKSRIQLLKMVVDDITKNVLEVTPESKFAFVPFDFGVPVLLGKNIAGGDAVGCSYVMTPKDEFKINYKFWANKSAGVLDKPAVDGYSREFVSFDYARMTYYKDYILDAIGGTEMSQLVAKGWCRDNTDKPEYKKIVPYSCEMDPTLDMFNSENRSIIDNEFNKFTQVTRRAGIVTNKMLFHVDTVDFEKTLNNMFDESSVITIPFDFASTRQMQYSPYSQSICESVSFPTPKLNAKGMGSYKAGAYLIDLTNDKNELTKFQSMELGGPTDSSSGLLRAVPILAKGENARKMIIVISDGSDIALDMQKKLHEDYNVCKRIRDGMASKSPSTKSTDIYFISVVNNDDADQDRVKYWANFCTGKDNSMVATNYTDLMDKLTNIMSVSEESGVFSVDE